LKNIANIPPIYFFANRI